MSKNRTVNHDEGISAQDTVTGQQIFLTGTNNANGNFALNTNGAGGSGGGGTQYAEGVTTAPATGTVALGRYKLAAPTLTDGQMYGLQLDASGNLKVTGSLSVGGTTDSAAWTAASSTFNPAGGVFNDSATALASGQQGTERLTPNRAIHTNLRNNSGTEIATSTNPLRIDPTGTTTQPVSGTVTVTAITNALPTGTNAIGTVGTTPAVVNVGQQTVNTTAVQVSVTSTVPTNGIIIRALAANAAPIYVGGSGVTTATGYELSPGESISFSCNLNTLYIRSVASTTDKICWNVE